MEISTRYKDNVAILDICMIKTYAKKIKIDLEQKKIFELSSPRPKIGEPLIR